MEGGNPCSQAQTTPSYQCNINIKGPWDRAAKPGYYLLWTTPNSQGHVITGILFFIIILVGPFKNYSMIAEVPSFFASKSTRELIVTVFLFNQYVTVSECPVSGTCYTSNYHSILSELTLQIRTDFQDLVKNKLPSNGHPRLFGSNQEWLQFLARKSLFFVFTSLLALDSVPCGNKADGWGIVPDMRYLWDKQTLGGSTCDNSIPATLAKHSIAIKYLNQTAAQVPTEQALSVSERNSIDFFSRYFI